MLLSYIHFSSISPCFGADFSFVINLNSTDNHVAVIVQNKSKEPAAITGLDVDLGGHNYSLLQQQATVPPTSDITNETDVQYPVQPGTYPIAATLKYCNEKNIVSLRHVGLFYYKQQAELPETCQLNDATIANTGEIIISASNPANWKLVLPVEIKITSERVVGNNKVFKVKSVTNDLNNVYPYFAVAEDDYNGVHRTALAKGTLTLQATDAPLSVKGKMPTYLLAATLLVFMTCTIWFRTATSKIGVAFHKFASRMVLITIAYLALKLGSTLVGNTLGQVDNEYCRYFSDIFINHFNGSNYQYFFRYFADLYYLSCLLLMPFYFYYQKTQISLAKDKYSSLMQSACSIGTLFRGVALYWNYTSKLGLLTFCVKIFFVPFLVSWVINNTFHQYNISKTLSFDFAAINVWLVALFIYIDTAIFCFGYLFEFEFLKNKIKSVEPTLLGWLVCLWCYPPFNVFSYRIFDYRLIDIAHTYPAWINIVVTCLITALWGIFTWASFSLGWKASNLTNRGIIATGPYRFVRHPAYAAKLLIFYLQGIFLGQYYLGLLLGFTIIYVLRAWTEERHLSLDQDYVEYKEMIRWRFIPGVI